MLRKKGVVDKFVEFYGPGLSGLGLADRATIANMAPEYGATMGFFPVDAETLRYLERTGRAEGRRRAGRALLQGAAALPHRRHARSQVHVDHRPGPLDRRARRWRGPGARRTSFRSDAEAELRRQPAGPHERGRAGGAEGAGRRAPIPAGWVRAAANVTIGEGGADEHRRRSTPTRRRSSPASSARRRSPCTTARWSSRPSRAAPTPPTPRS